MAKINDRIATLEDKLRKLKTREQRSAARLKAIETRRHRAQETRRKILVGAIVLAKVERGEFDRERFRGWLDEALTLDEDRRLFGLPDKGQAQVIETGAKTRGEGTIRRAD